MRNRQDDQFKKVRKNFLINESHRLDLLREKKEKGLSHSEIIRKALDFYFSLSKRKGHDRNGLKKNNKK